jgi:hypothetical protein
MKKAGGKGKITMFNLNPNPEKKQIALDNLPESRLQDALQLRAFLRASGSMTFRRGDASYRPARDLILAGLAKKKTTRVYGMRAIVVEVAQ